ncbi:hypothetical protein D1BOALGB6SA_38 [Olavius sp. associated proteobacterium Delta 1]|nr:hypothetical protein D1BOALGB6SA_38 [Olavius sp. associated proteobacterium Delta 1]
MKGLTAGIAIALIVVFGILSAGTAHAKDKVSVYEVTVTNITRGQIISPPIVISHNGRFKLFSLGDPATPGLAALAEDADTTELKNELDASSSVYDANEAGDVILPGLSATVQIKTRRGFQRISAAGMLVTTNDAFFAVRNVYARYWGDSVDFARAYDAGSEVNSEDCDYIPGPPCGNGGVRDTDGAEGYVYVHSGIHGNGDLAAADFDWQNPVAKIVVKKVK